MNSRITPKYFASSQTAQRGSFPGGFSAKPVSPKILFVDDCADVRDICGELLRQSGFRVDFAADGEAGWEVLSGDTYDLVITDHNMPRLSGLELARRIRGIPLNVPIILISGNMPWSEDDLRWVTQPGAVLQKPFGFAELKTMVDGLLSVSRDDVDHGSNAVSVPSQQMDSATLGLAS